MKRLVISALLAVTAVLALDSRLKEADDYYANRHKDSGYKMKAYNNIKAVLDESPSDAQALWRMGRIYCLFGDDKTSKDDKLSRYNTAKGYAEKAKSNGPSIAECHFWYGVSLGRIGQTKGVLNSLSLAGPVKDAFLKAYDLDSGFVPALDGLGVWYTEVPGFAGGDLDKAVDYFKKGLSKDPNYTLLYVDLAKVYIKQKKYSDARAQLNKCLSITNPTNPADFYLDDKPEAKSLLAEIEGK